MAYGRRRSRRRFIRRTRRIRRPSRVRFAKGNVRAPRSMRRFARNLSRFAESKIYRYELPAGQSITTAGTYIAAYSIPQGTGKAARVGSKIFVRYITLFGFVSENGSATQQVRMSTVWPRRPDNLTLANAPGSLTRSWNLDLFTVLEDRLIPLNAVSNPQVNAPTWNQGGLTTVPIKRKIPVFKSISFNDSGGIPDEGLPAFYFYSEDAVLPSPFVSFTWSITYNDV